jgi:hypothetical protein
MPAARNRISRDARIAFDALSIEGGLLTADWLARVAQLQAPSQQPADYRIPKPLQVRDEIGRYWRIAQAHWADFQSGRAQGGEPMALVTAFVEGLLRDALGFSIERVEFASAGEKQYPLRFLASGQRVPVAVAPAGAGLNEPFSELGDGRRRRSAFALLQEFLNASRV